MKRFRWAVLPVIFFALYIAYINYTAQNVIYMDQIRMVPLIDKYHNGLLAFPDLWNSQLGQHRHLGYQFYFVLNAVFLNLNTMIDVNLIAMLLFLIIMIFSWNLNRTLGKEQTSKFILLQFPFVLVGFGLIKWETALNGLGLPEYYGLAVMSILVTIVDLYLRNLINFSKTIFIILMLTTLAVALSALLPFYLSMAFLCIYHMNNFKTINYIEKRNNFLAVFSILMIQYSIYTYNINVGTLGPSFSVMNELLTIVNNAFSAFKFLLYALGATVVGGETLIKIFPDNGILFLGIIVLVIYLVALYVYFKKKYYTYTILPGFMMIGSLIYIALILLGRFSFGETYGMQSRYSLSMMFGLLGIVWCWALDLSYSVPNIKHKVMAVSTLAIIIFGSAITDLDELHKAQYRKEAYENMRQVISTQDSSRYHILQADGPEIDDSIKILKKYNLLGMNGIL
ncbi:MAG: hypothetical protein P4N59_16265 [Negativicutes bacterium]|nr:hypothetical protein [Negativicutes bacterium]